MTESDDWDELNRELGVSKPAPRADEPEAAEDDAELPEAEPLAEDAEGEADDAAEGGEADGAEGGPEEGPPGTGRKRRRRRRRKKKNGQPGEVVPAEGSEAAEDEPESVPATPRPRAVPARAAVEEYAETEGEDADEESEGDAAGETLAAEEDAGGELLRDLIAGWDVPPWDQVIGGLHRPGR